MDGFKSWIFSVCAAAIIITALNMLVPNSKTEKIMRFTIGLFFILLIGSPIAALANSVSNSHSDYAKSDFQADLSSNCYEERLKEILIKKVNSKLESGLQEQNINFKYLSSDINITEDNCIQITEVKVYASDTLSKSDRAEMRKYIKSQAGIYPEILT